MTASEVKSETGAVSKLELVKRIVEVLAGLGTVLSVVVGVVISVRSYNDARVTETNQRREEIRRYYDQRGTEAKKYEDERQDQLYRKQVDAARPFLELRQKRYLEVTRLAGLLVTEERRDTPAYKSLKERFDQLYWAELSVVEGPGVKDAMEHLKGQLDATDDYDEDAAQTACYGLAEALRNSLTTSWGVDESKMK